MNRTGADINSIVEALRGRHPQVLYFNSEIIENDDVFTKLLQLVKHEGVLALNTGEARLTESQCLHLIKIIQGSCLCFMFSSGM